MDGGSVRLQKIEVTHWGLEITYLEEADVDAPTGITEIRTLQIPHEQLDSVLLEELFDSIIQVIDDARTRVRRPDDSFIGPG
jgi:hypothetical protein